MKDSEDSGYSSSKRNMSAGVHNLGISKETYKTSMHNPSIPMRPGSQDAFNHPSLNHAGVRSPYWALKPTN